MASGGYRLQCRVVVNRSPIFDMFKPESVLASPINKNLL